MARNNEHERKMTEMWLDYRWKAELANAAIVGGLSLLIVGFVFTTDLPAVSALTFITGIVTGYGANRVVQMRTDE